jgi:hypothetical protein
VQKSPTNLQDENDLSSERPGMSWLKAAFRLMVSVAVLGSFGVWVYGLSGAARQPPPDELDSTRGLIEAIESDSTFVELDGLPAYAKRAEAICETTIDGLGDASRVETAAERASQLRESNLLLVDMVSRLRTLPVATERDDSLRSLWLDDWDVLIGDRERYADALEVDPAAVFTLSAVADNERLERRITRFARTNLMLPCGAPTDVG